MIRTVLLALSLSTAAVASSTYSAAVIPAPSGFTIASMTGINDSGQAAGTGAAGLANQAFIGSPSGSTPIPLPSGWSNSYGAGVNASGQVVGYGASQAFIGTVAGSTVIPFPAGWTYALGLAVNDSGQVAGSGDTPQGVWQHRGNHAGLYRKYLRKHCNPFADRCDVRVCKRSIN